MKSSKDWTAYFATNLKNERIDWKLSATLTIVELDTIIKSLQAWQLGETSDGYNLLKASKRYAATIADPYYVEAVKLFIKEEQKHGKNLGKYLDKIGQLRITKNWGDSLFRKIRYFNNSMEFRTLAVLTVESAAQIFYQSLKDATNCKLLQQICTDILIDEAAHINFQTERLTIIFNCKKKIYQFSFLYGYYLFYFSTALIIWFAHKKIFKAGGNNFRQYIQLMDVKLKKTIGKLNTSQLNNYALTTVETSILTFNP